MQSRIGSAKRKSGIEDRKKRLYRLLPPYRTGNYQLREFLTVSDIILRAVKVN